MASHLPVNPAYEKYAIYVELTLRGEVPGWHWKLYIPTLVHGLIWHAVFRRDYGGWHLMTEPDDLEPFEDYMFQGLKVGTVDPANMDTISRILGEPIDNDRRDLHSSVWVREALEQLQAAGVVVLNGTVDGVMDGVRAWTQANPARRHLELHRDTE